MWTCLAGWEQRAESAMGPGLFRCHCVAVDNKCASEVFWGLHSKLASFSCLRSRLALQFLFLNFM